MCCINVGEAHVALPTNHVESGQPGTAFLCLSNSKRLTLKQRVTSPITDKANITQTPINMIMSVTPTPGSERLTH